MVYDPKQVSICVVYVYMFCFASNRSLGKCIQGFCKAKSTDHLN